MRRKIILLAIGQLLFLSRTAIGQRDSSTSAVARQPSHAWIVPLGIAASTAADPEIREWILAHHSRSLDRLAKTVNPLGTAHRLIPAMAVTYVTAALTGHQSLATGVLNTAGAYIASDVVESVLKPVVGRQRPDVAGDSHRFRPFSRQGDWHSFPSAHVAHVTAIATAVEMQTHSGTIAALCDGLVALVAADRIYEDQHWSSDVTATAALTAMISSATVHWLDSRLTNRHHDGRSDR